MPPMDSNPGTIPASIAHIAIFNPTLQLSTIRKNDGEDRDRDDEDDQKEAAQIIFYTSRETVGVSRDKMLRQVGLAKGLMGFADMLAKEDARFWSIHSHKSRLLVYSPETDFYIYMCITLAHNGETNDPAPSCQGLSDRLLVSALERGYEDFRVLHGPLSSHVPLSTSSSSVLDKYFTRFSFNFESTYLSTNTPISTWLSGFPELPQNDKLENYVDDFLVEFESSSDLYIVNQDGPITFRVEHAPDQALLRYLTQLVRKSFPPPLPQDISLPKTSDDRQGLGLASFMGLGMGKRRKEEGRKTSWAASMGGWVPDVRQLSLGSREHPQEAGGDTTAVGPSATRQQSSVDEEESSTDGKKDRWGFNLNFLGEAVEGVGSVFKLGGQQMPKKPVDDGNEGQKAETVPLAVDVPATLILPMEGEDDTGGEGLPAEETDTSSHTQDPSETSSSSPLESHTEPSGLSLPNLQEAAEPDEEMDWDNQEVTVIGAGGRYEKRQLYWVISEHILIAILHPKNATSSHLRPAQRSILDLLSTSIDNILRSNPVEGADEAVDNPWIYRSRDKVVQSSGKLDPVTEKMLIDLGSTMKSTPSVSEIFAKTPTSHFVVSKQNAGNELYLLCGKKDASLTDADHSLRGLMRSHPELDA